MFFIDNIVIMMIALLHLYILAIEMFFWDKPKGRKIFGLDEDFAKSTKVLAANQGLYNGFLAAGLILSLITSMAVLKLFFLICIFVAGIFGGVTSNKKIIFIQSVPALIAASLVLLGT